MNFVFRLVSFFVLAVGGFLNFLFCFVHLSVLPQWFAETLDGSGCVVGNVWYFSYSMALCIALLHAFRLNEEWKKEKKSDSIEACTHSNSGEWNFLSVGISRIDVIATTTIAVRSALAAFHLLLFCSIVLSSRSNASNRITNGAFLI